MNADKIFSLIARQPKGAGLLQEFYSDPQVFLLDIERVHLSRWICVGHESRVRSSGDWFRSDIAGESIIIVRGQDDRVRCLLNVCRHRGSRVCQEEEGSSPTLVCPYHAWSYDLKGKLQAARQMAPDFNVADWKLHEIHVRILEGLIFVCFAEEAPSFDHAERTVNAGLRPYGWGRAKVAHRKTYSVNANWKLATDNYQECFHCGPVHSEFPRSHATANPDEEVSELRAESNRRLREMGIEIPTVHDWPLCRTPNEEMVECFHDALHPGYVTGSVDGAPLAPLMGEFSDYEGGVTLFDVGPSSFFLAYPDYGVLFMFIPKGPQETDMEVNWLVADDAVEGEDYDLERLINLWDLTSLEDKLVIEQTQEGVNSRYYQPGPSGVMETTLRAFIEWYLGQISAPVTK